MMHNKSSSSDNDSNSQKGEYGYNKAAEAASEGRESQVEPPPSYSAYPAASGSAGSADESIRANHIYIHEGNDSVRGSWTIDPNVQVPPAFLPELPPGQERNNLDLGSRNGVVEGKIRLISDQPTKSFLNATSSNGAVSIKILSRSKQRFYLNAESNNGSVTVHIPSDFEGPVTFTNGNGSTRFSEAVKGRLAHFNTANMVGRAFIGSVATSGFADVKGDSKTEWHGDELVLRSNNGKIRVAYVEEEPEEVAGEGSGRGFFGFFRK